MQNEKGPRFARKGVKLVGLAGPGRSPLATFGCLSQKMFKIFKLFLPKPLYELFNFSTRSHKNLYINTHQPSDSFEYRMSVMWNEARKILTTTPDSSTSISVVKNELKNLLLQNQTLGDEINWIEHNFYPF